MTAPDFPNPLLNGLRWLRAPYAFLDEARERRGPTFTLAFPGLGRTLVTGDPALIRSIVAEKRLAGGAGVRTMQALFGGDFLMTLGGEAHRERRRMTADFFYPQQITRWDDLLVEHTRAHLVKIDGGGAFSAFDLAAGITRRVIVRIVFGDLGEAKEAEADGLVRDYLTSFRSPYVIFLRPLHLDLGRTSPWGRVVSNRDRLRAFIRAQIRLGQPQSRSLLAELAAGHLAEDDLVSELFAFLMFGHDTTAVAAAWLCGHVFSRPEVVAKLQGELAGSPAVENPYLLACVDESLRLMPAVPQIVRIAEADLEVGGRQIRQGEAVMPSPYLAHRNPEAFPAPDRYIPERFSDPGGDRQFSYFPFGLGSRLCVGKHLARRQLAILLAEMVRAGGFTLAPAYCLEPERYFFFMAPKGGCRMVRFEQNPSDS